MSSHRTERILQAARRLWAPVPRPRPPKAKPQQSWQQLKPGQWLRGLQGVHMGTLKVPGGALWEVVHTDSLGARVECRSQDKVPPMRVSDPEWKGKLYERVRKPR